MYTWEGRDGGQGDPHTLRTNEQRAGKQLEKGCGLQGTILALVCAFTQLLQGRHHHFALIGHHAIDNEYAIQLFSPL